MNEKSCGLQQLLWMQIQKQGYICNKYDFFYKGPWKNVFPLWAQIDTTAKLPSFFSKKMKVKLWSDKNSQTQKSESGKKYIEILKIKEVEQEAGWSTCFSL